MRFAKDMLATIGGTPMVRINKLNPNPSNIILAKLEMVNPTGSVKDRIALSMIEHAEADGRLKKGMTVIEATSGNTGIGLALVCNVKGYKLKLLMPESASEERKAIIQAYGAEVILTPGVGGIDGSQDKVREIYTASPDEYFWPNQYLNPDNPTAHSLGTGPEILDDTGGKVTMFVAGIGTSGTLMGVSTCLKKYNRAIKIIGVMPRPDSKIQGLKNLIVQYVPGVFKPELLNELIHVDDDDAFVMARKLTTEEGIFSGMSCGAAMHVAVEMSRKYNDQVIVVLLPDGGEKYISTDLYKTAATLQRKSSVF
ncbi:MAG: cysteine synthase family protein [Candidatus Thermoplasmatota archaeon]|nr:cysteine synthase family protein [Euryarchaeota archaeon]MBU4032643.1 cysteine synthase family protein [Candidatus Thermoplasmatota archaeon]MBU4070742.1 cysteine synthase family protein [Candidatus Thermoplasmatota archaeon]MBU4145162.1 cysteine synthase family protein [Candidatus Thermoplasmatota archaeon]MBU4592179.1 cysteine synthase family protein [Candidatus Thermoplasmatota archaeon]